MTNELGPAEAEVQVDNALVKVTRWRFAPNTHTGWHRHGHDYVVVPTIAGELTVIGADGSRRAVPYAVAASYFRTLGAEHDVANFSGGVVEFVEIEFKATAG